MTGIRCRVESQVQSAQQSTYVTDNMCIRVVLFQNYIVETGSRDCVFYGARYKHVE